MKRILKNHNLQEGLLFLLISGCLLYYGFNSRNHSFNKAWSQSPFLFPVIVAVLLGVLAISLLSQGVLALRANEDGPIKPAAPGRPLTVLVVLLLTLAYYAALALIHMPYLGTSFGTFTLALSTFEVATIVFLFLLLFYLGVRKGLVLIILPLATTLCISVLFRSFLHVLLP